MAAFRPAGRIYHTSKLLKTTLRALRTNSLFCSLFFGAALCSAEEQRTELHSLMRGGLYAVNRRALEL